MDDVEFEVVLEPGWGCGDGRLSMADVEVVRTAAPAGSLVVRLRAVVGWETGAPEYIGTWRADCDVRHVIETTYVQAAREFVRAAKQARSALVAVEARAIAGGAARPPQKILVVAWGETGEDVPKRGRPLTQSVSGRSRESGRYGFRGG